MSMMHDSKEEFVRKSLFGFVQLHIPDATLSGIDDILLTYVVGILEEIGSQIGGIGFSEDAFDVDHFTEMMSAYLPQFVEINSANVCQWMYDLAASLTQCDRGKTQHDTAVTMLVPLCNDSKMAPTTEPVSTSQEEEDINNEDSDDEDDEAQIHLLHEMFPTACKSEIQHCLYVADGSTEKAAQLILHRQEVGESITVNIPRQAQKPRFKKEQNDNELRQHVLSRYMYVDQLDDKREHKPVAPKWEPKKLVRYRNNQIVSIKGEKYTEVCTAQSEDVKKTYVTLKPARQYRFH